MILRYSITEQDAGRKLKYVLRDRLLLSAGLLRRTKVGGSILLNGQPVFVDVPVSAGDTLQLRLPEEQSDYAPEPGAPDILWEDEFFLAVNKPAGLITHPTHSRCSGTLANHVLHYVLASGGEACHAVNRLDRDTSGVALFAKSAYAKSIAAGLEYEKQYLAAVFGSPEPSSGTVTFPIRRANEIDMRRIIAPDGSPSVTHYETVARRDGHSLLRLRLETGRTHQIRVHMLAIGAPLLGDRLYCTEASRTLSEQLGVERQLLHAVSLAFRHPLSGQSVTLFAPPPHPLLSGDEAATK